MSDTTQTPPPEIDVSAMVGELQPGQVGFIQLDEAGAPTGTASATPPDHEQALATPFAPVLAATPKVYEELTTPTGAPITANMNPGVVRYDAGMLERNPIPSVEPVEPPPEEPVIP